ncbi:FtsK/SpoIIIE domain-containing protein [Frankia sp. CcWB3]
MVVGGLDAEHGNTQCGEVNVSGTRRARTLVAGIQSSLGAALALADRLDEQADRIEAEAGSGVAGKADGLGESGAGRLDVAGELARAAVIARSRARGFAGASWAAPDWRHGPFGVAPVGDRARFRPALWQVGQVIVPPDDPTAQHRTVPLAIPLLDGLNLRIETTRSRRPAAVDLVRGLLTRVLAAAPAGRVRLVVYDPHELGAGLAGFAPLRAAGVATPTLTTRARLEEVLAELSAEVGRITVDRLGGRFDSLREREDAGLPRSEPWRVLVLLGEPRLHDEGARALAAIAAQGPSCGVVVISIVEVRPSGAEPVLGGSRDDPDEVTPLDPDVIGLEPDEDEDSVTEPLPRSVVFTAVELLADRPGWRRVAAGGWCTSLTGLLRVELDPPPHSMLVAAVTAQVAAAATREAARPPAISDMLPRGLWEFDSAAGVGVEVAQGPDGPVGFTFDDDTVHALVGGQAGSGKSTLLLDVIYGIAARYGPDQVRFHLLDFKEGLEFAQFAAGPTDPFYLPHADTVGIESDREFGVAVLRAVREQMRRRAVAMRAVGARDLRGLRAADWSSPWPRIIVVVDEFQVMLTPMDSVAREAVAHLEVLARQGRAYGVHLLLASQTLSGIDALDATAGKRGSIFGQFALRVALRTSISESRVLLSTANEAAGALSGVGEAIVNRRNGHPAGNELVRVAFPDPAAIGVLRGRLAATTARSVPKARPPRVFAGHAPAVLDDNPIYQALDGRPAPTAVEAAAAEAILGGGGEGGGETGPSLLPGSVSPGRASGSGDGSENDVDPLALVGVPLDLAPPAVGVRLAALPGRHLAVLGPLRREAVGILQAAAASVAAQVPAGGLVVEIIAAEPMALAAAEVLAARVRRAGHPVRVADVTGLRSVLAGAADETRAREESALTGSVGPVAPPLRLIVVFAMDAGRAGLEARDPVTRRTGLDDLRTLTRRGPAQRVHLLGWWRGVSRLAEDLGPGNRDDIAAWMAAGVPGSDLFVLAGHRSVAGGTMPNRAVLFDRHVQAEPRTVVPFAPLDQG